MQNTSHAVMAQRTEAKDSLDDFPTPPWATRALITHVLQDRDGALRNMSCLEPACGAGHMARTLSEYFGRVHSSDVFGYGFGDQRDFLKSPYEDSSFDWVVTNPPFKLAEEFVVTSLKTARNGVAIFARTVFIESIGRYENLFKLAPPHLFAQFTERVPLVKGRLDQKASTATGYCWLVWLKAPRCNYPKLMWIPPCRRALERAGDYHTPERSSSLLSSISVRRKSRIAR